MPLVIVQPPLSEPVTLAEAKTHLRVDTDYITDDSLIRGLITAARQHAEQICRRSLIDQTWKLAIDQFPAPNMNVSSANWYGPQWGIAPGPLSVVRPEGSTGYEIYLPNSPVIEVTSVKYIDQSGAQQTLEPSAYKVDNISQPARLVPAYGTTWPAIRNEINAVEVTYRCGYGGSADVPQPIKQWMLLRIGAMYENRESDVIVQRGALESLPFVSSLLAPYRVLTF